MKKLNFNFFSITLSVIILFSCQGNFEKSNNTDESDENSEEITLDYKILSDNEVMFQLGSNKTKNIWMRKNLNVSEFQNGDLIPEAKTPQEWASAGANGKPVWCYYNNDPKNGDKYGKIYNWFAVNDPRGLAPKGWHIAKCSEWNALENDLREFGGGDELKSKSTWERTTVSYNYPNIYGFSAVPGGYREGPGRYPYPNNINYTTDDGEFIGEGKVCLFWLDDDSNSQPSMTDPRTTNLVTEPGQDLWAACGIIEHELTEFECGTMNKAQPENMLKWMGLSVRCVKNK